MDLPHFQNKRLICSSFGTMKIYLYFYKIILLIHKCKVYIFICKENLFKLKRRRYISFVIIKIYFHILVMDIPFVLKKLYNNRTF